MRLLYTLLVCLSIHSIVKGATTYYSRAADSFNSTNAWSNSSHTGSAVASAPCSCGPCTINGSNVLYVSHAISIGCDLSFTGNPTVIIESGGSLNVTGNASVSGSATFTVSVGGTVNVSGNFNVNGGGGSVTIDGILNVSGNIIINGGFPFCGTGTVNFGGNLTGSGSPCPQLVMLPVTWLSVEAKYIDGRVAVSWATASEVNNDYFSIEKSRDGIHFAEIGIRDGAGTSSEVHYYEYADMAPAIGLNYYRIRQRDFDGGWNTGKVIAVYVDSDRKSITVYPTLISDRFVNIRFEGCENESADIYMFGNRGELENKKTLFITSPDEEYRYPLPGSLRFSTYYLHIVSGQYMQVQKIIITN